MATKRSKMKKLTKRLGAYSAAAAATAATAASANAAEVVWDIPDVTAGTSPGILFNLISGATALAPTSTGNSVEGSFRLASFGNFPYIAGPALSTVAGFVGPGSFGTNDFYPDRLNANDTIGSLNNFGAENDALQYGPYGYLSLNFTNTRGFVGLRFDIAGATHYGWAELTHLGAGLGTMLHAFGYNDEAGLASQAPETAFILGDTNNDGTVDTLDIDPFVLLLTDPAGYATAFPGVDALAVGDINTDAVVDTLDIDPFVALLTSGSLNGGAVPEPGTMGLLALAAGAAGLALFRRRKDDA